jgi:hypothetical protein
MSRMTLATSALRVGQVLEIKFPAFTIVVVLGLAVSAKTADACKGDVFHKFEPVPTGQKESPRRIIGVSVSVARGGGFPLIPCAGLARIAITLQSENRASILAARLRVISGRVPFDIPDYAVVWGDANSVVTNWWEAPSPAQLPFHARLAIAAVSASGSQGEWYEFDVWDEGRLAFLAWLGGWFWPVALIFAVVIVLSYAARHERNRRSSVTPS